MSGTGANSSKSHIQSLMDDYIVKKCLELDEYCEIYKKNVGLGDCVYCFDLVISMEGTLKYML
jgi:hypothetical protein